MCGALLAVLALPRAFAQQEQVDAEPAEKPGFDFSKWLVSKKGFLPIPIVITEPALGNGGGVALMFVRQPKARTDEEQVEHPHAQSQNLFGGGYAQTSNGSRFAFAAAGYGFRDDHLRWRGALAKVDANLDFYGIGNATGDGAARIAFSLDGNISSQQLLWRFGERNDFVAARWLYLDLESSIDRDDDPVPQPVAIDTALVNSGLGLSLEHDSRDSIFTPSSGWIGALETLFYDEAIGSDVDFQTYRAYAFGWVPFADERFVLGWRGDFRAARGDAPFYQVPFVELRGIPLGRYQDDNVLVGEVELRWNFADDWAMVGFTGQGRPWGRIDAFGAAESLRAAGVGVRYRLAETLKLYVGVDAARGPEETAYYLTVGSAWR
jgi:hypothetical protein